MQEKIRTGMQHRRLDSTLAHGTEGKAVVSLDCRFLNPDGVEDEKEDFGLLNMRLPASHGTGRGQMARQRTGPAEGGSRDEIRHFFW
eukprot:1890962-Amphidinium_carterae.1